MHKVSGDLSSSCTVSHQCPLRDDFHLGRLQYARQELELIRWSKPRLQNGVQGGDMVRWHTITSTTSHTRNHQFLTSMSSSLCTLADDPERTSPLPVPVPISAGKGSDTIATVIVLKCGLVLLLQGELRLELYQHLHALILLACELLTRLFRIKNFARSWHRLLRKSLNT